MKGGSMLERTNKRLILNGNCRTIIENNECMITQVSDPTGDGLMTMYHVFPGVSVLYSDFHMPFCESGFQTEYDMLCIDHCKEGCMEQEMGNGAYTYLEAGDLKIDRRIHHKGHIEFPTQHFHGVTIAFDMKELSAGCRFDSLLQKTCRRGSEIKESAFRNAGFSSRLICSPEKILRQQTPFCYTGRTGD